MNPEFYFQGITAFHNGLFASFYIIVAITLWIYHRNTVGAMALALQSVAAGLAQIFSYLIGVFGPNNPHLLLALGGYCCCASPTIMLCLREAVDPGWISWRRYFIYIGPFLFGTLLCLIFADERILYFMFFCNLWFCSYSTYKLLKGIKRHEQLVKQYFTDIEAYSHDWIRWFVYYQLANVIVFFFLNEYLSVSFNIIFNYVQAFYWLYFILKCKQHRVYSRIVIENLNDKRIISKEYDGDVDVVDVTEVVAAAEDIHLTNQDKNVISTDTLNYIEKRLNDLDSDMYYLDDTLNLSSLAQAVGTNRTYMSNYFRFKDTTFWDYINRKRCEYAVEIMRSQRSISMSDLARNSGYKTENCFRTSFSAIYGKTPFVYKRELMLEKE